MVTIVTNAMATMVTIAVVTIMHRLWTYGDFCYGKYCGYGPMVTFAMVNIVIMDLW